MRHIDMLNDIGENVHAYSKSLDYFLHEDIYTKMEQILNLDNTWRYINKEHCRVLDKSFHKSRFYFKGGMKAIHLSSASNVDWATYTGAVYNIDDQRLMRDGYCMTMINTRYRCRFMELMRA